MQPSVEQWARTGAFLATEPVRAARSGQTPHAIVHRQGPAKLRYFAPAAGKPPRRPVFVSMPLINTWTIFDLLPGQSVVGALVAQGVPVYLLDWGCPGPEHATLDLDTLIDGVLPRALERCARHARAQGHPSGVDALGYCVGGTFLAIALARHAGLAHRMALLATPIDFHESGRLARWAKPATFPLDALVDGFGNFPAWLMKSSFGALRPSLPGEKWRHLAQRIDRPGFGRTWAALERWNGENIPFAGEAYRSYVRHCYFENALITGAWRLAGRPVDLSCGTLPALVLAAQRDHICPPAAAEALAQTWGGPVEVQTLPGGHVGVCLGAPLHTALLCWSAGAP